MRPSVRPFGGLPVKGSPVRLRAEVILQAKAQWPYWGKFWADWDWTGFIRPCIDAAAANGANAIQVNGDGIADAAGSYPSDAVFQARVYQICNYAAAKGLVVLWQLGFRPYITFPNAGAKAANIASAAKVASWLQTISNVVAIDVMNEWDIFHPSYWNNGGATGLGLTEMRDYIAAVRNVFSRPLTASVTNYALPYHASIAPYVDFHCYHNYDWQFKSDNYIPVLSDITTFKAQSWYKGAFVIGETGMPLGGTAPQGTVITTAMRRAYMTGINTQASDADCLGCVHWGLYNTTGYPDSRGADLRLGQWGSVDDAFAPYPDMVEPMQAWPSRL